MKRCPRCKTKKSRNEFFKSKSKKDGLGTYCKECMKPIQAEHYKRSPHRQKQVRDINKKHVREKKEFIKNVLLASECVDCGNKDIRVLEFDHVRGEKIFSISSAAFKGFSLSKIQEEIDKCEVRCANCHRIRTCEEQKWYKSLGG